MDVFIEARYRTALDDRRQRI